MDILKQYLDHEDDVIGKRTAGEKKYDLEVLRWMRKGKDIRIALSKANAKYPSEALQVTELTLPDVLAHYEYLDGHEAIVEKLTALKKRR